MPMIPNQPQQIDTNVPGATYVAPTAAAQATSQFGDTLEQQSSRLYASMAETNAHNEAQNAYYADKEWATDYRAKQNLVSPDGFAHDPVPPGSPPGTQGEISRNTDGSPITTSQQFKIDANKRFQDTQDKLGSRTAQQTYKDLAVPFFSNHIDDIKGTELIAQHNASIQDRQYRFTKDNTDLAATYSNIGQLYKITNDQSADILKNTQREGPIGSADLLKTYTKTTAQLAIKNSMAESGELAMKGGIDLGIRQQKHGAPGWSATSYYGQLEADWSGQTVQYGYAKTGELDGNGVPIKRPLYWSPSKETLDRIDAHLPIVKYMVAPDKYAAMLKLADKAKGDAVNTDNKTLHFMMENDLKGMDAAGETSPAEFNNAIAHIDRAESTNTFSKNDDIANHMEAVAQKGKVLAAMAVRSIKSDRFQNLSSQDQQKELNDQQNSYRPYLEHFYDKNNADWSQVGAAGAKQMYDASYKAVEESRKAYEADPARFIINHNSDAKASFNRVMSKPPAGLSEADRPDIDNVMSTIRQVQSTKSGGFSTHNDFLPKDVMKTYSEAIKTPDGGMDINSLNGIKSAFGEAGYSQIMRQLLNAGSGEYGLPKDYATVGLFSSTVGMQNALKSAHSGNEIIQNYEKDFPGKFKDLSPFIRQTVLPYANGIRASDPMSSASSHIENQLNKQMLVYAIGLKNQNSSLSNDQVNASVKQFLSDNFVKINYAGGFGGGAPQSSPVILPKIVGDKPLVDSEQSKILDFMGHTIDTHFGQLSIGGKAVDITPRFNGQPSIIPREEFNKQLELGYWAASSDKQSLEFWYPGMEKGTQQPAMRLQRWSEPLQKMIPLQVPIRSSTNKPTDGGAPVPSILGNGVTDGGWQKPPENYRKNPAYDPGWSTGGRNPASESAPDWRIKMVDHMSGGANLSPDEAVNLVYPRSDREEFIQKSRDYFNGLSKDQQSRYLEKLIMDRSEQNKRGRIS